MRARSMTSMTLEGRSAYAKGLHLAAGEIRARAAGNSWPAPYWRAPGWLRVAERAAGLTFIGPGARALSKRVHSRPRANVLVGHRREVARRSSPD